MTYSVDPMGGFPPFEQKQRSGWESRGETGEGKGVEEGGVTVIGM